MSRASIVILAFSVVQAVSLPRAGSAQPARKAPDELNEARQTGWQMALLVAGKLEADDLKDYPGIQAWFKDFHKAAIGIDLAVAVDHWPALESDALVTHNPNFWQAYYEIAPGDPGLMILHSGLLLAAGEATRASHLIVVAEQRPGIPKEIQQALELLLAHTQRAGKTSNELVIAGTKLYDQGDYAGALKKHRAALALWPQNGFAHYELGLTLRQQEWIAAGEKPPARDAVIVNGGPKHSREVRAAFSRARTHDPLQIPAYQGDEPEVIRGLEALALRGMPAWQKVVKDRRKAVDDDVLIQLARACQEANVHELALAIRQVLVARRGRYVPADHPFIAASLRKLAPGEQTERVLKRLGGGRLELRQLVAPELDAAEDPKGTKLQSLRLYVPIPELPERIGKDPVPLTNYVKALVRVTAQLLETAERPKAKGILIAVGIKPGKKSHVWCQAVEGDMPAELLRKLEKRLEKVEAIAVKERAMAFGLEVALPGQKVERFPQFPAVWLAAAKKTDTKLLVPPDELFKSLWPD